MKSLILLLLSACCLLAACHKNTDAPARVAVTNLLAPVKDTCYDVPCSSATMCVYIPVHKRIFMYACFDPVDAGIVYGYCVDSLSWMTYNSGAARWLKINLATGDTSSFRMDALGKPEVDIHGWVYYINTQGRLMKVKTDGSALTDLSQPIGVGYNQFVSNDGTRLLFHTFQGTLLITDHTGTVISNERVQDICPNADFLAVSPDFSRLLFLPRAHPDSLYIMDRVSKTVIQRLDNTSGFGTRARFSADNKTIMSGNFGGINVIDIAGNTSKRIRQFCLNRDYFTCRFSPDGQRIITAYTSNLYPDPYSSSLIYIGKYASILNLDGSNEQRLLPE